MPGDIIILHKCTKNHDNMLSVPEIWHVTDVVFIFNFGLLFSRINPLTARKIKLKKKKVKKRLRDIILHKRTKNHDHMLYYSWDMAHDGCNLFFILGYIDQ